MASLNLNALKNLSLSPVVADVVAEKSGGGDYQAVDNIVLSQNVVQNDNTASEICNVPKISLMKLKRHDENNESPAIITENKESNLTPEEDIKENVDISPMVPETVATSEIVKPREGTSIFIDSSTEQEESPVNEDITETVVPREFFPELHLSEDFSLLDDDLGVENNSLIIAEKSKTADLEKTAETAEAKETAEATNESDIPVLPPQMDVTETSSENIKPVEMAEEKNENAVPDTITNEYREEVKTELSEKRRAGFRFFAQKKVKILAGLWIIGCFSVIGILFTSVSDIVPVWKVNVSEIPWNAGDNSSSPTNTVIVPTVPTVDVIPPSYQEGRDYSVKKNTKKNVRNKPPVMISSPDLVPNISPEEIGQSAQNTETGDHIPNTPLIEGNGK